MWIKSRLIFHHWITNLTIGYLNKNTSDIWAIGLSKIQIWHSDEFSKFSKKGPTKIVNLSAIYRWFFSISSRCSAYHSTTDLIIDLLVPNRYIIDISNIFSKFFSFDNWCSKSFWDHPISDISEKYIADKIWNFNPYLFMNMYPTKAWTTFYLVCHISTYICFLIWSYLELCDLLFLNFISNILIILFWWTYRSWKARTIELVKTRNSLSSSRFSS